MYACHHNPKLEVIRYLIEYQKMDVRCMADDGKTCLTLSFKNKNIEIARYLIEKTNTMIKLSKVSPEIWGKLILLIRNNFDRFQCLLKKGIDIYAKNDVIKIIQNINPILLSPEIRKLFDIKNPFNGKFTNFIKYVDELYFIVPIPCMEINKYVKKIEHSNPTINYTEQPKLLFKYNENNYYGWRERVYDSIVCLREIMHVANFDENIILSGNAPIYIINMWIESMYTEKFDIMQIKPDDLISFLIHIDQYPTNILTIENLEYQLIDYLGHHNTYTYYDNWIKELCMRCGLKLLYLYFHNKELESIIMNGN